MIMGDKNGRGLRLPQQGVKILTHATCHIGIQIAEWFVEEEEHRAKSEGPGESDALLLTSGEFMWIPMLQAAQAG